MADFTTGDYAARMTKTPLSIGLAVPRSCTFDRDILRGIARYAVARPQWLFASIIPDGQPWRKLGSRRPAGLIASVSTDEINQALASWRCPIVNVAATIPKVRFPSVRIDNAIVGAMAANHFLERGLKHFAFVGPTLRLFSVERHAAFSRALAKLGFAAASYFCQADMPFDPFGRRWDLDPGVRPWLLSLPKPLGLLVPNDLWGVQITEACRELGVRVPEDVAILGVDNDDLDCELPRPRLSSITLPSERIGYEAAALLDRLLQGEPRPRQPLLLPPLGVATRRSTEVLAIEDREVVKAVRFIREHPHLPLHIADVARQVSLGRRTLERRCQAALGWSLGEEIRRVRLERARHLLSSSDLPMKAVAKAAGFSGFRHLGEAFRQYLGVAPTTYRRQTRIVR